MYCPNCGSDNQSEVKFCRRCGTGLAGVSAALAHKAEDQGPQKSQLADLIKQYYSARHKMMFGAGSVALGIALTATLLATGSWGFFWIFFWVFMALFGNGIHQFTKGWKDWSEASIELKTLGYSKPPTISSGLAESQSPAFPESHNTETLPSHSPSALQPPSVTESTTRHLDSKKTN